MFSTQLDHLVVAAATLEDGVDYIRERLNVDIPPGGRHEAMGTHNHVMTLGEGVYLEVIAINPTMSLPDQPRWFGLDDPYVRASLIESPRLLTWAVNTTDLTALVQTAKYPCGRIYSLQRDDLKWKVAITEDGSMPGAGCLPLTIEWQVPFHPSTRMQDLGCRLEKFQIQHSQNQWLDSSLSSINANHLVEIHHIPDHKNSAIHAVINTPSGEKHLSSQP